MKILVTGGAGFIGSHVVDGYLEHGHEVVVIDNLSTGNILNINPNVRFYLLDIRSEDIKKVFEIEKPDIVNHHAAQISVPESVKDPIHDADINIKGLLNLLKYSVKFSVKKFIFISCAGVYGDAKNFPTPETEILCPFSPYAIAKFCSEYYINFYKNHYGIDYTILRYANIYGPRQNSYGEAGVVSIFINSLKKGDIPIIYHYPENFDGMTRDYCYVKDVVNANIMALTKGSGETINIGTSIETTTGQLYRIILQIMRTYGYATKPIYDKPKKAPARAGDIKRSVLSIEKAKKVLEWKPCYELSKGLEHTIKSELKT